MWLCLSYLRIVKGAPTIFICHLAGMRDFFVRRGEADRWSCARLTPPSCVPVAFEIASAFHYLRFAERVCLDRSKSRQRPFHWEHRCVVSTRTINEYVVKLTFIQLLTINRRSVFLGASIYAIYSQSSILQSTLVK